MFPFAPPTACLPPIKSFDFSTHSIDYYNACLQYLRVLYNPSVRGSRRRKPDHGYQSASDPTHNSRQSNVSDLATPILAYPSTTVASQNDLDVLRSDEFERSYSIRWLTALISHSDVAVNLPDDENGSVEVAEQEVLLASASSLLALLAGPASSGILTRTFSFSGPSSHSPVEVLLTDVSLENADFRSVGAQTWGGACVLAERIVEAPHEFGLVAAELTQGKRLRVLELGAGTGLVGLTLAKLLEGQSGLCVNGADIILSDYYPAVLDNLTRNVSANFPPCRNPSDISVLSTRLDWAELYAVPAVYSLSAVLAEPFDLVLGADIIYEPLHSLWIQCCLQALMQKSSDAVFHLVIPLRRAFENESATVEEVFAESVRPVAHGELGVQTSLTPLSLKILSKETIVCDALEDGLNEVEYVYYRIGWIS